MSKLLLVYFTILALLTIAACVVLFPFQLDDYKGGSINTIGVLGVLIIFLGGIIVLLINVINIIVFLIRQKYRMISLSFLILSILSLCWPIIVEAVVPYDSIVLHRAKQVIKSDEFKYLRQLYLNKLNTVHISVLPKSQYLMVGDYVINFQKNTYGKLNLGIGFFAEYYTSGDAIHYSNQDSLITGLPYHLDSKNVNDVYNLMKEMDLSDAYVDTLIHSTVFAWEQSAGAGTRGIILNDTLDITLMKSKIELSEKEQHGGRLDKFVTLSPGIYYFRTSSYNPF